MRDLDRILECISPDVSYDEWLKVGMALKHEGYDVGVWDSWSSGSSKYKPNDCIKKWDTFKESGDIVTGGTLIQMAKDYDYPGTMRYKNLPCWIGIIGWWMLAM